MATERKPDLRQQHRILVIQGLGDQRPLGIPLLRVATNHWRTQGLEPSIHTIGWHDPKVNFEQKLRQLIEVIDGYAEDGDLVSLVGVSAGGSAVLNAFIERREKIHRVINVCGRLKVGPTTGSRSFESSTKTSPTFSESVLRLESQGSTLSDSDKLRVMTVRASFGDELVPSETTIVEGAYNTTIPTAQHMLSIGMALTVFSKPLIDFLKQGT